MVIVLAIMFSAAGVRALQFQVFDASAYAEEAVQKMRVARDIEPLRGQILDRDGKVLAFTEATVDLVAYPNLIATNGRGEGASEADRKVGAELPAQVAPIVAKYLERDASKQEAKTADIRAMLAASDKKYVKIASQVGADVYEKIKTDLRGDKKKPSLAWVIDRESNPKRQYPMNTVASNVLGYMGVEEATKTRVGRAGLEQSFESQLAGTKGREVYENSKNGKIPLADQTLTPAVNGTNITTTIDSSLCWATQQLLDKGRAEKGLEWGFTVVMEVKTGKVLCLANSPSFNGNEVGKADAASLGNPAMLSPFEPGSTMKVLTLAAVLDVGAATPDSVTSVASYNEGIKSGSHIIRDSERHPAVDYTTRGILVNSSNQGVIQLARKAFGDDKQRYVDYLKSFGLGQQTNIGIPGETAGVVPFDDIMKTEYTMDSVSFGTSLSVNAIQMAAALNGIVNNGVYVSPSIIQSTATSDGVVVKSPAPTTRRVVSEQTSQAVRDMMEQRVLNSYKTIGIESIRTGAKTGTARMGRNDLVMSTAGVAPVEDPQVLVYTVYFQKGSQAGAGISAAGPVYHDVMALALQRYGVLPSQNAEDHCTLLPLSTTDKPKKVC